MFGIPIEHVIPIANFVGLGILGLLAFFGQRWGQKAATPAEKAVEVAGALVDATSVKQLSTALEAHTAECAAMRRDSERTRKIGHEMVEAVDKLTREISEVRDEMRLKRR